MKKKLILASVIAALSITACGNTKAPKFKSYSNEVSFDVFYDVLSSSNFDTFFNNSNSVSGSSKMSVTFNDEVTVGEVVLSSSETTSDASYDFKYDAENNRAIANSKQTTVMSMNGLNGTWQNAGSLSLSRQYQMVSIEDEEVMISIDKAQSAYYIVEGETNSGEIASYRTINGILSFFIFVAFFDLLDEAEKAASKFYIDDNLFTVEYDLVTETIVRENDEKILYTRRIEDKRLYQLDLSLDNVLDFKYSLESSSEFNYYVGSTLHEKGEKDVSISSTYCTSKLQFGNINIKEINISSFALRDKDLEDI